MRIMKAKCTRCRNYIDMGFIEWLRVFIIQRKVLCDKCYAIDSYENYKIRMNDRTSVSDDECRIGCYDIKIYEWINDKKGEYCAFFKTDYSFECGFLLGERNGNVLFEKEIQKEIPVYELKLIKIVDKTDRRYYPPDNSFMYGYKGICVEAGILGDNKYIYEYGIPYEEEYRNPFFTDYQDVYSHYCSSMEDVLVWRDYISMSVNNVEKGTHHNEYRLFKIKAEGHFFKNSGAGWVSNRLTVISEVTQREIIDYFKKDKDKEELLIKRLERYQNVSSDIWGKYCKVNIPSYNNNLSDEDALRVCVETSPMYGAEECSAISDIHACETCRYAKYCFYKVRYRHYSYLKVKNFIKRGEDYSFLPEYQFLLDHNRKRELSSLERLSREY